jgi:hypothetical protein
MRYCSVAPISRHRSAIGVVYTFLPTPFLYLQVSFGVPKYPWPDIASNCSESFGYVVMGKVVRRKRDYDIDLNFAASPLNPWPRNNLTPRIVKRGDHSGDSYGLIKPAALASAVSRVSRLG